MHNDIGYERSKNCVQKRYNGACHILNLFCFKSSTKSLVSFSASKYFMTGFYFKDLLPCISVLITVSSSHLFQRLHKLIWVYHFFICLRNVQRNDRRWMLHKYVGNKLKESTLLNNEHEHVKRYYAYKNKTFNN